MHEGFIASVFISTDVPLEVRLTKALPQEEDSLIRDTEGDQVLDTMKRLILRGEAREGTTRHEFELILELRGRVLSVGRRESKEPLQLGMPERIGEAIIREMGAFVARPIGHTITREEAAARNNRPEWIVSDAPHVAGLLHRVHKRGLFVERSSRPIPGHLKSMRVALIDDVISNYGNLRWLFDSSSNLVRTQVPQLTTAMWDVYGARFVEEADDSKERESLARYFEGVREFRALWEVVLQFGGARRVSPMPAGGSRPDIAGSATLQVRTIYSSMLVKTPELVEAYGNPDQREKLAKTSPVNH